MSLRWPCGLWCSSGGLGCSPAQPLLLLLAPGGCGGGCRSGRSTGCGSQSATRRHGPTSRTTSGRRVGQLLGGAAVLIGAAFAYLQFTQQQRESHQQFTQQQQASRDLLISNQVAKGFELLGNKDKDIMQRLGGIYALEGVMNNSEDYHQPVLDALSAFVRLK